MCEDFMTVRSWFIAATLGLSMLGCGATRGQGVCPDKSLVELCSPGFRSECETTDKGCEQCSCVPISDDQGRPAREF